MHREGRCARAALALAACSLVWACSARAAAASGGAGAGGAGGAGVGTGSVLYAPQDVASACWTDRDLAKLRARRIFENVRVATPASAQVTPAYTQALLRYFKRAIALTDERVQESASKELLSFLPRSVMDSIGGHLRHSLLPQVRLAYYAGYISYADASALTEFYEEVKAYLDTQGLGWRAPERPRRWMNFTVAKLGVGGSAVDSCADVVYRVERRACVHVPTPRLDDVRRPTALALPFRRRALVSLTADAGAAEGVLLRYYVAGARCILHAAADSCRHESLARFNEGLCRWLKREVTPHLTDETLYTPFGGVMRVVAQVQDACKAPLRPAERAPAAEPRRSRKKALRDHAPVTWPTMNRYWKPVLYLQLVMLVAVSVWVIQYCLSDATRRRASRRAHHAPHAPAPGPAPHTVAAVHEGGGGGARPRQPAPAVTRVYDLNENKEKMMDVARLMKRRYEKYGRRRAGRGSGGAGGAEGRGRPASPPRIETSVYETRVGGGTVVGAGGRRGPVYSTSVGASSTCVSASSGSAPEEAAGAAVGAGVPGGAGAAAAAGGSRRQQARLLAELLRAARRSSRRSSPQHGAPAPAGAPAPPRPPRPRSSPPKPTSARD